MGAHHSKRVQYGVDIIKDTYNMGWTSLKMLIIWVYIIENAHNMGVYH